MKQILTAITLLVVSIHLANASDNACSKAEFDQKINETARLISNNIDAAGTFCASEGLTELWVVETRVENNIDSLVCINGEVFDGIKSWKLAFDDFPLSSDINGRILSRTLSTTGELTSEAHTIFSGDGKMTVIDEATGEAVYEQDLPLVCLVLQ
jgi:uncharacterized protein YqkB